MRNRPLPNTRRGLLRASLTVVVLCAILLGAIFVVSSLTAPSVNAPTAPPTPGPIRTPISRTPGATSQRTPAAPRGTPRPTSKHDVSLGPDLPSTHVVNDVVPSNPLLGTLKLHRSRAGALRNLVAYFGAGTDAYKGAPLFIRDRAGHVFYVGTGDPYVRPVWRPNMQALLYARVRLAASFPAARWSLVEFDLAARHSRVLIEANGMAMSPLGWSHGHILYSLATEASTDLYRFTTGGPRFISILITQPVTTPSLSPSGDTIAFDVPASCTYCTLDTFNLDDLTTWNGPTGALSERNLAWTDDGNTLVTVAGTSLAAINIHTHHMDQFAWPSGLPQTWVHPLRAAVWGNRVRLTDEDTMQSFSGRALTHFSR